MTGRGLPRRRFLQALGAGAGAMALARRGLAAALAGDDRLALAMVRIRDERDLEALGRFDATHRRVGDEIEVLLRPGDKARLDAAGLNYRVTEADLAGPSPAAVAEYRHLADYEADLAALAAAHPTRARVLALPHRSRDGRAVFGLEIASDVAAADGRPVFYIDGLHHAREWPSGEMAIMFAEDLLTSYASEQRIRDLLAQVRVVVVPVVNVDGFHHARESLVGAGVFVGLGQMWRKSRRTFGDDVARVHADAHAARFADPSAYGVDLNRNYPFHWNGPGSSFVYADETHTGPWPYEPEIANVESIFASRHVTTALSNHTYSELVLWPWGDTWTPAPDAAALRSLGEAMAGINGYWAIQGIELYPTTGTTIDWAYGNFGTLAYTFELGQGFHPEYAGYVEPLYARNRGAFLLAAEAAADPANHGILRGSVSGPATLTLRKTWFTPFYFSSGIDESRVSVLEVGAGPFEWHVNPSTRPLAAGPEAYSLEVSAGSATQTRPVTVGRGQVLDLGDVTP